MCPSSFSFIFLYCYYQLLATPTGVKFVSSSLLAVIRLFRVTSLTLPLLLLSEGPHIQYWVHMYTNASASNKRRVPSSKRVPLHQPMMVSIFCEVRRGRKLDPTPLAAGRPHETRSIETKSLVCSQHANNHAK